MPVKVIWDDEKETIIRQIYIGVVTIEDYYSAIDQFSIGSYINALRYGNGRIPDNVGLRIIIKVSSIKKMMINVGARVAPRLINNVHFVNSIEQAYTVIASHQQAVS